MIPDVVKVIDVEGGKQVVLEANGMRFFTSNIIFASPTGTKSPELKKYIEDGIVNGFQNQILVC